MIQKQNIILMHYQEGKSQRTISRITGLDRKTISKYIKKYEQGRQELLTSKRSEEIGVITDDIVETPKYTVGKRPRRKVTPEIEQAIIDHIKENDDKKKRGQRKQVKKVIDIYESLVKEHNINISYSTVLSIVRRFKQTKKEAFIKANYLPGDVCEFDWGEVKITIAGRLVTLQLAVFTSAKENYRWAHLFTKQKTECFQEAHALFFEQVGGVFSTLVYDNMKVAVKKFVGTEREPTKGLLQLSLYYGFKFRFCNVARGNEKGHVERSVEITRRKAFAFKDDFENLDEANHYLAEVCNKLNSKPQDYNQGETAETQLHQARKELLVLPPMFDAARTLNARVDKYSSIVVDQNHYSVPDYLVGKLVFVKIYSNRIFCFDQEQKIAEHMRQTGVHGWSLNLEHYLNTFEKKPGALASSLALKQAPQIKSIYEKYYTNRNKDFIELLNFMKAEDNNSEIMKAIVRLENLHPSHVTTAKIKILCATQKEKNVPSIMTSPEDQAIVKHAQRQLKQYDELFNMLSNETEVCCL